MVQNMKIKAISLTYPMGEFTLRLRTSTAFLSLKGRNISFKF